MSCSSRHGIEHMKYIAKHYAEMEESKRKYKASMFLFWLGMLEAAFVVVSVLLYLTHQQLWISSAIFSLLLGCFYGFCVYAEHITRRNVQRRIHDLDKIYAGMK